MKSILLLAAGVAASSIFLFEVEDKGYNYTDEYSTYFATTMAYFLMNSPVIDDDVQDEGCDGSGWITHGDGHKTPCPGCDNCNKTSAYLGYEYKLYFFTADWCSFCKKMKRDTWSDSEVIKELEMKGIKVYVFDRDDSDDKKFFDYYKVSLMPTILIFKDGDLRNPIAKNQGYIGPDKFLELLEEKLK